MAEPSTATASVATAAPERYAKQLASHLGRRSEVREEPDGTRIVLAVGDCLLVAREGFLDLLATAPGPDELDVVMRVVGSHLERFGQRNELQVSWQQACPAGAPDVADSASRDGGSPAAGSGVLRSSG